MTMFAQILQLGGQVHMTKEKSGALKNNTCTRYVIHKKIYLSWTNEWDFFQALICKGLEPFPLFLKLLTSQEA